MDLKSQKQLAAKIMKTGVSRVRMKNEKEVDEAITRNDIRKLIVRGMIYKVRKKGVTRIDAEFKRKQKGRGRRKSGGSRKGSVRAKKSRKRTWIEKIRPLRRLLMELRSQDMIKEGNYRKLYRMAKAGFFRNKKHLLFYLKEHEYMKEKAKPAPKKTGAKKTAKKVKKNEKG